MTAGGVAAFPSPGYDHWWSYGLSAMKELQIKDAKATLSAVVDRAIAGEPTVITRHGRKEAVLVSFEEWQRFANAPSFADLLLAFPGEPRDIPERRRKPARALGDTDA
ncbi:type II toxin-antitoxin system Phd/YefM family antitoxin [Stella sp.]|uniref:type II toxin-antitoxin system Phd/YefM family antitoxin n=1 Tax=Stella sp. TaxID=2912054 RepID=UPI0035AF5A91